jgi:PHP family Zn ribbon phosphoesterase
MTHVRKYLVKTDAGSVIVQVNPACQNALDDDLLLLSEATPEAAKDLEMEVPLRAFSAKMLDIIETVGTGDFSASPKMLEMLKREKASSEMNRIERFARERA